MGIAATLDAQGEIVLAGDVRYFANHLPKVLTDRERLAQDFLTFVNRQKSKNQEKELVRDQVLERTADPMFPNFRRSTYVRPKKSVRARPHSGESRRTTSEDATGCSSCTFGRGARERDRPGTQHARY